MNLRRVLLLGALALGLVASGVVGPAGVGSVGEVATAHAKGSGAAKGGKAAAKPATKGAKSTKGGKATKTAAKNRKGAKNAKGGKVAKGKQARGGKKVAAARTGSPQSAVRGNRTSGKIKLCKDVTVGKGRKARVRKKCSFVQEFQGHGAGRLEVAELTQPSGDLWLRSENLQEEIRVQLYKPDGEYDEAALAALDNIFRCKRSKEVRAMDPRLYDQLSRIQDHFGGKQIEVVSGFRFVDRDSSRHFHASAMDIKVKGASVREQYTFAQALDRGGMGIGIYPHSGFIHVDFRAPGEASYRWTDYSGPNSGKKATKKKAGRTARAKRPTS
ncbi:MAG: YcbK family protein [Myxococcales bacterium]|nr:YcbK family protein [Myxococcales bacterium]